MANTSTASHGEVTIPRPPDDLLDDLVLIDFERDEQLNWSERTAEKVDQIVSTIQGVDAAILELVVQQTCSITELFEETIKATQALFAAMMRLKNTETDNVQEKKERMVKLLRTLERIMHFLRNV
jgi:hypothetical protein